MKKTSDSLDLQKSLKINRLISDSYNSRNFPAALTYIEGSFLFAKKLKRNWNHDNIKHRGYTYSGLIALKLGRIEEANRYLILSAALKGSPQLRSFGPDMILANELLDLGQQEIVLDYLHLCGRFWRWPLGFFRLRKWKSQILRGQRPNFGINYDMNIGMRNRE